ncbi:hypothetical protein [Trichlorobacter ammonificans]|uniref:Uncharacterized protein n=1 Tax=Trichlorobacter ammonificans TaxID=2916410 RepID=A0ABM9DDM3_9BACT|nr:hypothetical protein [Trichlorobacter ammonificans]CAH2032490.1 protein of unknown function [Trichlorobacter ammonificans]
MTSLSTAYAGIARLLREQELPNAPVDHQWEELLYRLTKMDDPEMREYGMCELNTIHEQESQTAPS